MSLLVIFLVVLGVLSACLGSWKAALYWDRRSRPLEDLDPRDQEIRELRAALNVTRNANGDFRRKHKDMTQSLKLSQESLNKTQNALANCQQKYTVTKEVLNKEQLEKEELVDDVSHYRAEMNDLKNKVHQQEMELQLGGGSEGLVSVNEQMADKAQAEEIKKLKQELDRWKQHCQVLGKNAKVLRAKLEEAQMATQPPLPALQQPQTPDGDPMATFTAAADKAVGHRSDADTDALPILNSNEDTHVESDKLQDIKGIGTKLEQKLHLVGIHTFKELLDLKPEEYERVGLLIPNFEKRMTSGWLEQARSLHQDKYLETT
ncbi:MAG: hypothetical protein ACR2P6_05600 [Gammaproteobacteria bacterium]